MSATTNSTPTSSVAQNLEAVLTNRILGMQALILCRDEVICRVLARTLFDMGITPRFFEAAEVALEALTVTRFDLAVVDCDDVEGGLALLQLVHRTPSNKTTTVLALVNNRTRMQAAFQIGAMLALQKPFSASLLGLILRASQGNILRERRRSFRYPVELQAWVSVDRGPETLVTAINLSEDGMALQAQTPFPVNQPVRVRFSLPHTRISVEAEGSVAWSDRNGRTGIRFLNIQQFVRRLLEKWLQAQFEQLLADQKRESASPVPSGLLVTTNQPQHAQV